MIVELIADYFDKLVDPFINPQKRVFIGYLVASIIAAIVLSYLTVKIWKVTMYSTIPRRLVRYDHLFTAPLNHRLVVITIYHELPFPQ